jgi:hypothetical protein
MRSANVVVMIFVALTLCTCCCVIPACDTRRGWSERFIPPSEVEIDLPYEVATEIDDLLAPAHEFEAVAADPTSR